ncbi:unnamed protein product, partial [Adineta ricciae]
MSDSRLNLLRFILLFKIKTLTFLSWNVGLDFFSGKYMTLSNEKSTIEFYEFYGMSFDDLTWLQLYTTNMKSLSIHKFTCDFGKVCGLTIATLITLKLHDIPESMNIHQLFKQCLYLPQLNHLELEGELFKESHIDGNHWRYLIENYIPHIKRFRFFFFINDGIVSRPHNDIIESYKTDFWLRDKKWFVNCDYLTGHRVFIYTLPCIKSELNYLVPYERTSTSSSSAISVPVLHLDSINTNHLPSNLHFDRVRSLSIYQTDRNMTYEQLRRLINISSVEHLIFLDYINPDLFFDILKYHPTQLSIRMCAQSFREVLGISYGVSYLGVFGITTVTIAKLHSRYNDTIEEHDEFSIHTNEQHKKYFISGMHHPFLTNDIQQLALFHKHFARYEFLIGNNLDEIKEKHALKTPVYIQSMKDYHHGRIDHTVDTLVVGGPPALISAVHLIQDKNENLIYLNNFQRIPIANGSAWHLEQDAHTEAPTSYKPTKFLRDQLKRLFIDNISLKEISTTGEFPWRTIDWLGWISHPNHWYRGFKLLAQFQIFTMFHDRTNLLNDVAKQCFINEKFFDQLDISLNKKLLLDGYGSIIIARNKQEINDLDDLKKSLLKEGRNVDILSKKTILNRYGFIPNGLVFGEKIHDRVLVANFMKILCEYLVKQGRTVIDGTLKTIYYDDSADSQGGGIIRFQNQMGEEKSIKFSRLILSLGSQEIFTKNNKRLYDVVSARGVSMLAHVYIPKGYQLPPVLVCGGTNHATKLSTQPISVNDKEDLYLMRFTAGACVTPNVSDKRTAFYDESIALGLITSVRK